VAAFAGSAGPTQLIQRKDFHDEDSNIPALMRLAYLGLIADLNETYLFYYEARLSASSLVLYYHSSLRVVSLKSCGGVSVVTSTTSAYMVGSGGARTLR
jgi:hypothetical protein